MNKLVNNKASEKVKYNETRGKKIKVTTCEYSCSNFNNHMAIV